MRGGSSSITWTTSAWFTFEVPTSSSWTVTLNQRSSGCLCEEKIITQRQRHPHHNRHDNHNRHSLR